MPPQPRSHLSRPQHLLLSCKHPPNPTTFPRSDVANAVLDGVDGFLLGQETLRGGYPREAVQTILQICKQVGGRAGRPAARVVGGC
jgi:pyruvate kinase